MGDGGEAPGTPQSSLLVPAFKRCFSDMREFPHHHGVVIKNAHFLSAPRISESVCVRGLGPRCFTLVPGDADSGDAPSTHSGTTAAEASTEGHVCPNGEPRHLPPGFTWDLGVAGNIFGMEQKGLCKHCRPPELSEGKRCSHRYIARSSPQPTAVIPRRKPGKLTGQVGGQGDAPCGLRAQGGQPDHHPCPRTARRVAQQHAWSNTQCVMGGPHLPTGSQFPLC